MRHRASQPVAVVHVCTEHPVASDKQFYVSSKVGINESTRPVDQVAELELTDNN